MALFKRISSAAMRSALALLMAFAWLGASCSSSSPNFTLTGAAVDSRYFCPGGASNAPYNLHATIQAHNPTGSTVTIKSITTEMTLASVKGDWLEKVGERYDAGSVSFTPTEVAPRADATLRVTIPSACTSGAYGTGVSSSGDYLVRMRVVTSAGAFSITADNEHEIVAA